MWAPASRVPDDLTEKPGALQARTFGSSKGAEISQFIKDYLSQPDAYR